MIPLIELAKFDAINWLYPIEAEQKQAFDQASPAPFMHARSLNFFTQFAEQLLLDPLIRPQSQLVALAFWLRSANLRKVAQGYAQYQRKPLGQVVQIAPNNIDTLFFYSMVLAVLAGNKVIVRLGNKRSDMADTLIGAFVAYLQQSQDEAAQRICLIKYPRNDGISTALIEHSDGLVVWGGDSTITYFDSIASAKQCTKLYFPDRYSIALMGDIPSTQMQAVAQRLITDISAFQQQACASPRAICWLPEVSEHTKQAFWQTVETLWQATELTLAESVDRQVYTQYLAMSGQVTHLQHLESFTLVNMDKITADDISMHCGNYVFLQQQLSSLADIEAVLSSKLQGISTVNIGDSIKANIATYDRNQTIRRWVALGQSLQFEPVWDGQDICLQLSMA